MQFLKYVAKQKDIKYKNDVSTLPVPLSHGVSTYSSNVLELKKFF